MSCPRNVLPDSSAVVPDGVWAGLIPYADSTAMKAMQICCETETINTGGPNNCTLWCELPDSMIDAGKDGNNIDKGDVLEQFMDCIGRHEKEAGLNRTVPSIYGISAAPSASRLPSLAQLGVAALGVALAMQWA
ncbi:hypothetical protein F5X68DRAFT_195145 [Plectosphaerella plurivora]|uniref:Uncharacterized protein n=1 Tax=Plectosphaerella plurivora TaxID=936078 RepID=A0A9P8UZU7_9PEZI|nr:hypothetical protein F5X68DRAFT_195145 [Plectosphaerella plurivora]